MNAGQYNSSQPNGTYGGGEVSPKNGDGSGEYTRTTKGNISYGLKNRNGIGMTSGVNNQDVSYFSQNNDEDVARREKLALLNASDKDTIESQQKRLLLTRQELEELKLKYNKLKRNYDSVSHYAAKDNAEFQKLKNASDSAQSEVNELKIVLKQKDDLIAQGKEEIKQ